MTTLTYAALDSTSEYAERAEDQLRELGMTEEAEAVSTAHEALLAAAHELDHLIALGLDPS
jgi:hypothetical protein